MSVADFDQTQLWKQINDCLDRLCGKTVIEQLVEHGHDEIVAQVAASGLQAASALPASWL